MGRCMGSGEGRVHHASGEQQCPSLSMSADQMLLSQLLPEHLPGLHHCPAAQKWGPSSIQNMGPEMDNRPQGDVKVTSQHSQVSLRIGKWQRESRLLPIFRRSELGEISCAQDSYDWHISLGSAVRGLDTGRTTQGLLIGAGLCLAQHPTPNR